MSHPLVMIAAVLAQDWDGRNEGSGEGSGVRPEGSEGSARAPGLRGSGLRGQT